MKRTPLPTNGNPPKLTLDQLPTEILDLVMDNLHQFDLIKLCLVSKAIYWSAVKRLYKQVSFVFPAYFPDLIAYESSRYYTVSTLNQLERFLATVTLNKKVSNLIESLSVAELPGISCNGEISAFFGMISPYLHLTTFHHRGSYNIPRRLLEGVKTMSCYMYPGVNFPQNVVELKIIYEGTDSSIDNFRMLGNQMIKQDSYHKLRKLEFKVDDFSPSIKDVQTKQRSRPYWAHFFNPFVEQGIQLKLTALGIEGEFRDDADDNTADILSEAIQLSELDTLDIVYCAYVRTHELESHEDGVHTFLDKITERLPGLRYLSVKHSRECHEYEINALRRILQENIANQLYQLRIVFENQSDEQLKRVRQAILHSQHYLVKLKVALESFWNNGDDREFIGIPALEDLVQEAINHKSKRDMLAPSIFDFDEIKPFIPEYLVRSIISYRRRILNALKADVIYKGAAQNLPYLTEYYFIGLYISIKEQSFFVNGRPILLDEKA